MRRSIKSEIQEIADGILLRSFPSNWFKRSQGDQTDIGVDFEIEVLIREDENYSKSTGEIFKIQNKGHKTISKLKDGRMTQQLSVDNVKYFYSEITVPTILTVVDVEKEIVFWHPIQIDKSIHEKLQNATSKETQSIQIHFEESRVLNQDQIPLMLSAIQSSRIAVNSRYFESHPSLLNRDFVDNATRRLVSDQYFEVELTFILEKSKNDRKSTLDNIWKNSQSNDQRHRALQLIYFDQYDPKEHNVEAFCNYRKDFKSLAKKGSKDMRLEYLARVKFADILNSLEAFNQLQHYQLTPEETARSKNGEAFLPNSAKVYSKVLHDLNQLHRGIQLFGIDKVSLPLAKYLRFILEEIYPFIFFWKVVGDGKIYAALYDKVKHIFHPMWAFGLISHLHLKDGQGKTLIIELLSLEKIMTIWMLSLAKKGTLSESEILGSLSSIEKMLGFCKTDEEKKDFLESVDKRVLKIDSEMKHYLPKFQR